MAYKYENRFKDDLIDFKKPNLWMHTVERTDTGTDGQVLSVFAIFIAFCLLVAAILYAASEYPKAYPTKQSIVKPSKN